MLFIADNDELYEQLKTKLIFRGYDVHCIRTDDYARSDYYSPLLNVRTIEDVERIALRISSEEERYLMTAFLEFAACDVGTFAEARELAEMTAEGVISDEPAGKIAAEQIVSRTDCAASIDTDDDEYAGIIKDAREIYTKSGGKL